MNNLFIGLLVVAMIGLTVFIFWGDIQAVRGKAKVAAFEEPGREEPKDKDKKKKDKGNSNEEEVAVSDLRILERWDLPGELVEISGITFTGPNEVAGVQDEAGTIYLYNLGSKKITRRIPFGDTGDYEGITIAGNTAYIIRADGTLFEVTNYQSGKPAVKKYQTGLTESQDVEGLTYDTRNKCLLLAIKGEEPGSEDYKGIYAFNLSTKKLDKEPVYRILLDDTVFKGVSEKKKKNILQPSDLAVHPTTGELYITEGAKPKLLVMDASGKAKNLYRMSTKEFTQPEGIAFNEGGEMFISNEGGNGKGTILKVALP
jgi:uncharacterized protein YjiK